jgi:hypothetical protein
MYYQQPCPHCGHRAGWKVEGRRVIITHYYEDGTVDEVEHKPDKDVDTGPAQCRVCGAKLDAQRGVA